MKLISATTIIAALSIASIGHGYADGSVNQQFSKEELHKMVREAHSTDQYRALAKYFRAQQIKFQQQAQAEKAEWERRSYEYFTYEAAQMDQQASHYESLDGGAQ